MTSLSGEFQTDLPIHDAIVPCTEAVNSLAWRIETVEADRVVAYTDREPEKRAKVEVDLAKADGGTDIRITGSDSEANPVGRDGLIPELNKARDAIEDYLKRAEAEGPDEEAQEPEATEQQAEQPQVPAKSWEPQQPEESAGDDQQGEARQAEQEQGEAESDAQAPAGWYPDVYDESRLRYWDGQEWTDDFKPADEESKPEEKPRKPGRKEARAEKRRQSRERAEQRRRLREEDRRAKEEEDRRAKEDASEPYDAQQENRSRDAQQEEQPRPVQAPAAVTPARFRSLLVIATIYGYLGWIVAVLGTLGAIAAAANADGSDRIVSLISGLVGAAFAALVLFGIAAAIRLALAVEENTRNTVELLRERRESP
jgi:hypothetical protein